MSTGKSTEAMVYDDITLTEVSVSIKGDKYALIEANGEVVVKWRNMLLKGTKIGSNGRPSSIETVAEAEPYLVSLCLYYADKNTGSVPLNKDGEPDPKFLVPIQRIKKWPNYIQMDLFKRAKEISRIDEEESVDKLKEERDGLSKRIDELENGEMTRAEERLEEAKN